MLAYKTITSSQVYNMIYIMNGLKFHTLLGITWHLFRGRWYLHRYYLELVSPNCHHLTDSSKLYPFSLEELCPGSLNYRLLCGIEGNMLYGRERGMGEIQIVNWKVQGSLRAVRSVIRATVNLCLHPQFM